MIMMNRKFTRLVEKSFPELFEEGNSLRTHLDSGLADKEIIAGLINGKSLLSVGSGTAVFERFLERLGTRPENITLGGAYEDDKFDLYDFNIFGRWPTFQEKKFDYVLFPGSLAQVSRYDSECNFEERELLVMGALRSAFLRLNEEGEIRADGFSAVSSYIHDAVGLLKRAYSHAEVSMGGGWLKINKR